MKKAKDGILTRRRFVTATAVAAGSAGALAVLDGRQRGALTERAFADEPQANAESGASSRGDASYGMFIDARKCTGCGACLDACHRQNHLKDAMDFIRFEDHRRVDGPASYVQTVPLQCMHCADAPCAAVCPTGATHIQDDGVVAVDASRCIGCKYCMAACPFDARVYDEEEGTVDKCRLCASKVAASPDLMITCVQACGNGVRIFGDLNDPESDVSRAIAETGARPLGEGLAQAKFYYVG